MVALLVIMVVQPDLILDKYRNQTRVQVTFPIAISFDLIRRVEFLQHVDSFGCWRFQVKVFPVE